MDPRPQSATPLLVSLGLVTLALALGCSPLRDNDAVPATQGEACGEDIDCGPGLVCAQSGTCEILGEAGTAARGEPCVEDTDCRAGLLCNGTGRCGSGGSSGEGQGCQADSSCDDGLVCGQSGMCASPGSPGTTPADSPCETDDQCAFGLLCGPEFTCVSQPRWTGVECGPSAEEGPTRMLFEVPRGEIASDFFRLPFPNDTRARGGSVDLAGFPGVDVHPEPGDLLGRYVTAVREEGSAFGPDQAAIFRFSGPVDFSTLDFGNDSPNFQFIDITPDADSRGRLPRSRFYATGGRSRYVCPNWLGIRPSEGTPLGYGNTYAVLFRAGITDNAGAPLVADDDLTALLGDVPPEHPALQSAWTRYAPLRSWLADDGVPTEDVVGATVFTVSDPRTRLEATRTAVVDGPAPTVVEAVACDAGVTSPCADAGRTCDAASPEYVEVHALVSVPNLLQGVPPYTDWGGDTVLRNGQPRIQRQEQICVMLTVPRGSAPGDGWPVTLFAHGLGGDARTAIESGLAARLSQAGWATVGYDGVLHGGRFGGDAPPTLDQLVAVLDDYTRPGLMRDQAVQGAADLFALARLLQTGLRVPTGVGETRLSPSQVAFIGHGRGGAYGVPFAAYEPGLVAAVFAGAGGDMIDWLNRKTAPRNLSAELRLAFADPTMDGMHPALHLMQTWLAPRDPVHYGLLLRRPPEAVPGKHVLFMYGVDDPITPPTTMNYLALAMRLSQLGPGPAELTAIAPLTDDADNPVSSVRGNVRISGQSYTQVLRQYTAPDGSDGHRVLFDSPAAQADLAAFFQGLVDDEEGIPTLSVE